MEQLDVIILDERKVSVENVMDVRVIIWKNGRDDGLSLSLYLSAN